MLKRVWGALDAILSCVGFAALVLIGVRWWRGLPVLPTDLLSAPSSVSIPKQAAPPSPTSIAIDPAPLATLAASTSGTLEERPAPWRDENGGGLREASPVLKNQGNHNWSREISVTINASRYVKSLADIAPSAASLPPGEREAFKAALAQADRSEMLMVCSVTVEYSGATEVALGQMGWKLVSPERETFSALPIPFATRDIAPLRASLLPNGRATGDLVFPVKRGTQADEIIYQP